MWKGHVTAAKSSRLRDVTMTCGWRWRFAYVGICEIGRAMSQQREPFTPKIIQGFVEHGARALRRTCGSHLTMRGARCAPNGITD
jgi:hypothetical protein